MRKKELYEQIHDQVIKDYQNGYIEPNELFSSIEKIYKIKRLSIRNIVKLALILNGILMFDYLLIRFLI